MSNILPPNSDGVNLTLDELLYYKQQSIRWLPPAKSLWSQMLGQHQSRRLGRGMDFSEVRQYQAGDDIRAIDWRVTARTGKPHTKLFSEEKEKPIILFLDLSSSMLFGSTLMLKSVQVAHLASLIAWICVAQQDRVGAIIDTGEELIDIKPSARQKGALTIIQSLVTVHQQLLGKKSRPTHDLADGLMSLSRLCPKGSEITLLSDFSRFSDKNESILNKLSQHNRLHMVQIIDPLEQGQTQYRGLEKVTDNKEVHWLDFSSRQTREGIRYAFEQHQQKIKTIASKTGIRFSSISCDTAITQQLHGL